MTSPEQAFVQLSAQPPCVLVVMDNPTNAVLVRRFLGEAHNVLVSIPQRPEDYDAVDLIIVDGVSLHRYGRMLANARDRLHPLQLPVLLLADRDEPYFLAPALESTVDDMIRRPVSKSELSMRIRALLRSRSLSLDVLRMQGLYETERAIAQRFQQAALPQGLPNIEGIRLSAYYHAGHRAVLVGGDWYDALELDDGRLVVSIGDVCGSGLDAAVLMAHVRQVIRGVAQIHPDPSMMLDAANRNICAEYPGHIVTALAAVVDPVASLLHYANAGHLPALLRHSDGSVEELLDGHLPLGVAESPPSVHSVLMPPGATLLLYTDGLVEFDRDFITRDLQVRQIFAREETLLNAHPARHLFSTIMEGEPPDDVAILLVRRTGEDPKQRRWRFSSEDAQSFAAVRDGVRASLSELGLPCEEMMTAELILAELVGNVVRYAPGTVEIVLDRKSGRPTLHVLDSGPSFFYAPRLPSNLLSESGRGLFLVKELSRDFNVTPRPQGGSHARAVLR